MFHIIWSTRDARAQEIAFGVEIKPSRSWLDRRQNRNDSKLAAPVKGRKARSFAGRTERTSHSLRFSA